MILNVITEKNFSVIDKIQVSQKYLSNTQFKLKTNE